MDLTQAVQDARERASAPAPSATINRDAYPVVAEFDAPGGIARIVTRSNTGATMVEYEPDRGKVQRVDLAAIPAVGFVALNQDHRNALLELFPDDFGHGEAPGEPSSN